MRNAYKRLLQASLHVYDIPDSPSAKSELALYEMILRQSISYYAWYP